MKNFFGGIGKFFLKSKLRTAILLVLIVVAGIYLLSARKQVPQTAQEGALPTPTAAINAQDQAALKQNKDRIISLLPVKNDKFTIQYFPDQDYFFVQIQQQPYEANQALAKDWFKQNGLDPELVNIEWGSVRGAGPSE